MIVSPCISVCKTDPVTGYCYRCGRSDEDKKNWKIDKTSDEWKKKNLLEIKSRLKGWQLENLNSHINKKLKMVSPFLKKNYSNKIIINSTGQLHEG